VTTPDRVSVLFVMPALSGGGAERVLLRILRQLDRRRFRPVLLLFEKTGPLLPEVPADVPVLDCGRNGGGAGGRWLWNAARVIRAERPAVVFSFLWFTNLATVVAHRLSGCSGKLILSERLTIDGAREGVLKNGIRKAGIRLLYRRADAIVANSAALREQLLAMCGLPANRVVSIPNPLDIDDILARSRETADPPLQAAGDPLVVGMGRLVRQKGFDTLIRAVALLRTPARLVIVGEGPRAGELLDLAERSGIVDRVSLAGFRANPYPLLRTAAVFVLSSRYEGFPNALLEAMALGVPVVATRCSTGPEEIVSHGVNGLLVPVDDPAAIAAGVDRLLADQTFRERLGRAAQQRARSFDIARIMPRIESLIGEDPCAE
jgi:glycosyltransferase involved in cell wall biosynthesis